MNFSLCYLLLRRFTLRRYRRGFINFAWWASVIGIVLGVIALIISQAVLEGFDYEITNNAIRFSSHVRVFSFDSKPIFNWKEAREKLKENISEVSKVIPTIEVNSIIKTKAAIEGVLLKSYFGDNLSNFSSVVFNGSERFQSPNCREIILGDPLARSLGVQIGDSVVVVVSVIDGGDVLGTARYFKLKVSGIFESGMGKYDESVAIVPFEFARLNLLGSQDGVSALEVYVSDISNAKNIANRIEELLGYPFYCFTFYELHSSIFAWIELQREPIPLVLSLMTIVASLNVVSFLLINILENTKSIGILVTLGMKPKQIVFLFVQYGMLIGFVGISIGCLISFLLSFLQLKFQIIHLDSEIYYLNAIPISINYFHYIVVVGFTFSMVFLASLLPSIIASRLKPVRALRFSK